jgi:ketosteroid isomerase-like protein
VAPNHLTTVREIYAEWGRGNFRAGTEHYDPNVLLVLRPDFPDPGTYCGLGEIERYMREDFLADFADLTITGDEFLPAGDTVVVRLTQRAKGPESGAPVAMSYYQLWTFRGDAVVRIESVMEREDALAAAGLSKMG